MTLIDNAVDATTGTIRLKATFANQEGRLWPGQFANVALTLATQPDAVVVPSAAHPERTAGHVCLRGKAGLHVDLRPVVAARTQGSETVIAKGLEGGERVVTDGQPRLTPGVKVEVRGAGGDEGRGGKDEGRGGKGEGRAGKGESSAGKRESSAGRVRARVKARGGAARSRSKRRSRPSCGSCRW